MIFVTIGSVFPFDRLIETMDVWATADGHGVECFAQIGAGTYKPAAMPWRETLTAVEFAETFRKSEIIVSHAGMGSAITAMQNEKPIVLLPRRFEAGEHTTDHQMATARWLEDKPGIFVAWDEAELPAKIAEAQNWSGGSERLSPNAPKDFTDRLNAQMKRWAGV